MSNKLETFIRNHKEAFEDHEPSAALWKRLEKKMQPAETPGASKVVKINWWKWAAAAMIIITAGVLTRSYWQQPLPGPIAGRSPAESKDTHNIRQTDTPSTTPFLAQEENKPPLHPDQRDLKKPLPNQLPEQQGDGVQEELYHYARLIEIKQKEIATLKNNHPDLFEQFSNDLTGLNQSYTALKQKYDQGVNSEQLLSAMIDNLKMQTELLNKQLEITKKLKQQTRNNEQNYKSL